MGAGQGIVLIPCVGERLEAHRARVEHDEPADQAIAEADDLANHFERDHRPDHAGERAEDAGLRAGGGRSGRGGTRSRAFAGSSRGASGSTATCGLSRAIAACALSTLARPRSAVAWMIW